MTPTGYAFESRKYTVQLLSADMLLSTEASIVGNVVANNRGKLFIGQLTTNNFRDFAQGETEHRIAKKRKESGQA